MIALGIILVAWGIVTAIIADKKKRRERNMGYILATISILIGALLIQFKY